MTPSLGRGDLSFRRALVEVTGVANRIAAAATTGPAVVARRVSGLAHRAFTGLR